MPDATHQTTQDIEMGNRPCWTLPKGTRGTPVKSSTASFRLETPIRVEGFTYDFTHLSIGVHQLEPVPSEQS